MLIVCLCANGCANFRLPAIDPSGQGLFLPRTTTIAPERAAGLLPGLTGGLNDGVGSGRGLLDGGLFGHGGLHGGNGVLGGGGLFSNCLSGCSLLGGGGIGGGGIAGLAGNTPAWISPPQPASCQNPGFGGVPYSIYGSPPAQPTLPAAPLSQLGQLNQLGATQFVAPQATIPQGFPTIPTVQAPGLPLPGAFAPPVGSITQLTGQTSADPRDGIPGRMTINPTRMVAPVGQEVILRASICGPDGLTLTGEPIEWSLSPNSVGTILEVDETNKPLWRQLFRRPPYKVDGSYAMGLTSSARQIIPRGGPGGFDDLTLERGHTWISVTSASEGATHVTGRAKRVAGWEDRRSSATIHWIDGQWRFPNPQSASSGSPATLCTQVVRSTTGAPIAGWRVQYRIAGGTQAAFADGSQSTETTSDSAGQACVQLALADESTAGVTHVQCRIIRPGQGSDLSDIVVGEGTTTVTFNPGGSVADTQPDFPNNPSTIPDVPSDNLPTAPSLPQFDNDDDLPSVPGNPFDPPTNTTPDLPNVPGGTTEPVIPARVPQLQVSVNGPQTTEVGATVVYEFEVRNPDSSAANEVELSNPVPFGLRPVDTQPEARRFGDRLVWPIGNLPGGQSARMQVKYVVENAEDIRNCAILGWRGAQPVDDCFTTQIERNPIQLEIRGDQTARIGENAVVDIFVRNIGNRRLENITVTDTFPPGLFNDRAESPMEAPAFNLEPGEQHQNRIVFQVRGQGRQCHTVEVEASDGSRAVQDACINSDGAAPTPGTLPIIPGAGGTPAVKIQLQKVGAGNLSVGQNADFTIKVTNVGSARLTNLQVENQFDPRLTPTGSIPEVIGPPVGNVITWPTLPVLNPGQHVEVLLQCKAQGPAPRVCQTVVVRTAEGVSDQSDVCLAIFGPGTVPGSSPLRGPEQPNRWLPGSTGSLDRSDRQTVARPGFSDVTGFDDINDDSGPLPAQSGLDVSIESLGTGGMDRDRLTYFVQVTNTTDKPEKEVVLMVEAPAGTTFVTSLNPPMIRAARASSDKRTVEFTPIATLRPNETAKFRVVVAPKTSSIGRFRAKVTSDRIIRGAVYSDRTE